ncbi:TetR/AcrR family transcriptional regulator [Tsukamurella ocularis]|uniref:TetR/AcrR family transcriptional regulator n=1 Tax=Tsukamurella ocularis TaxID=1970234 RepID=UPI002166F09E|nr:TetR/AcrR family transcriptional regulator [Tsukamurella ocularis]MCS3782192.1 AcrR family transcriptional regulator [Tsukamurella ocularis]MCS3789648.1 AcrR family transcriptional regulator [Tsukamurella ocularis]MCS3852795.1 AcrR family transcriptional regulator [Tsukamurella ocularis]
MNASLTARERARAELTAEITRSAREQLREVGAAALSLRAVARDLGLASSAVYRYFSSRDALLTALITDAYTALGDAVEAAEAGAGGPRERWLAAGRALRTWALANPHEYTLLYGSPVPGYHAPAETTAAAIRTSGAFARIAMCGKGGAPAPSAGLNVQLRAAAEVVAPGAEPGQLALGVLAWTQLFGAVSFELFGQYANTFEPASALFDYTLERTAEMLGL